MTTTHKWRSLLTWDLKLLDTSLFQRFRKRRNSSICNSMCFHRPISLISNVSIYTDKMQEIIVSCKLLLYLMVILRRIRWIIYSNFDGIYTTNNENLFLCETVVSDMNLIALYQPLSYPFDSQLITKEVQMANCISTDSSFLEAKQRRLQGDETIMELHLLT